MDAAERGIVSPDGSQMFLSAATMAMKKSGQMQSDGQHAHKILGQPGDNCESVVLVS